MPSALLYDASLAAACAPQTRPATVLVGDPSYIVAEGVRSMVEGAGVTVAAHARSTVQLSRLVQELLPSVLLLDGSLLDVASTQQWRAQAPGMSVIVLLGAADEQLLAMAMDAGASGVLLKSAPAEALRAAITTVVEGGRFIDDQLRRALTAVAGIVRPRSDAGSLSPAELRVLRRLSEGLTNREISIELAISPHTVKSHLTSLTRKLGCRDRVQAIALAITCGLV